MATADKSPGTPTRRNSEEGENTMLLSTDSSVKEQHLAVRNHVGWYDFTHRVIEVSGPDALPFLEKIYTGAISNIQLGRAKYTTMLNEDGLIIDDVIIFRLAEDRYWVSTLYSRDAILWYDSHRGDMEVSYRDITAQWKMYSVQGPHSAELVNKVVSQSVDGMRFFSIQDNEMNGLPVKVARSGYTGEKLGYEIYIQAEHEAELAAALSQRSQEMGACHVTELDVMVMTLACEAGFVLMMDIYKTSPYESGFEKGIDWTKEFIGKEALTRARDQGVPRQLVGFTVEDDEALIYGGPHGAPVMKDGKIVGRATKYTHGFTVGKNIGYALIEKEHAAIGDKVLINGYPAVLTERHFL